MQICHPAAMTVGFENINTHTKIVSLTNLCSIFEKKKVV